jgi:hypothetical protein
MRRHVLAPALLGAIIGTGIVIGIVSSARDARSQPSDPVVPGPAEPLLVHAPFTPYAADEGALSFEELGQSEQDAIVAQRNREAPEALAARFEMMRAMTIARGERTHAEVAASMIGLEGFATDGVVP